jgi:glycosyltransferase involved in cell wall biosynthesis
MRILVASDASPPQVNGVVHTLSRTLAELRRMGHQAGMVTSDGLRTVPCPSYPQIRLALRPGRAVAEAIERFAPDALHIATEGPIGLAARRHALRTRRPFSTAFHTRFPEYVQARTGLPQSLCYRYLRWFHDPAEHVMVATPAMLEELRREGFSNAALWGRGVDLELFSQGASTLFDRLPRPVFLSVGRVAVEKNLEAFLSLDLPGSKVVIGDGPELPRLRARHPQAHFLGAMEHSRLPPYYRAADVFVFPSRTDTFGLVMLEAMACGLPVAAYPVPGPKDVVDHLRSGVLDVDLHAACLAALHLPRSEARAWAARFGWEAATRQFCASLAVRRMPS